MRVLLVVVFVLQTLISFAQILDTSLLSFYVDKFNSNDNELYKQYVENSEAKMFLANNIPLFECPDKTIEEIYYFRWWTFRKHIKKTPEGFIITEFLPSVPWAGKYNGICCPAWFHFREGRWLHNSVYLKDYADYWLKGGGDLRSYSFPITNALYQFFLVYGNNDILMSYYKDLLYNYELWKKDKYEPNVGLFWQIDDRDGMEVSIGGNGYRATINSYMAADVKVLAKLAYLNNDSIAGILLKEANDIKNNLFQVLWDNDANFLKVLPRDCNAKLRDVRELHGYTPWAFNIADDKYSIAWKYLMDTNHFFAPYGLTTAEQSHRDFKISYDGHECQWNGPSWPYATSMTLIGLINLLNDYEQKYVSYNDFYTILSIYAKSQYRKNENGILIPWIDENLNPYTGDWISRTILTQRKNKKIVERGRDYNHSLFCDLVITGIVGLRPSETNILVVNPLISENTWDYFCLDNVFYKGRILSIVYDKTGKKYNKGKGLYIFVNGEIKAFSEKICKLKVLL
ncbi:MAG: hypothetical protein SOR57_11850 [Parabacteroides sp.]|nr:hypothetical protein [Parabacteroides sp.]